MSSVADLVSIAVAFMTSIHPSLANKPDAQIIADGIAVAVDADTLPPLTGTREGDVELLVLYAYLESSMTVCGVVGKIGEQGAFQILGYPKAVACAPADAAAAWMHLARQSISDCARLPEDERLAELVSGSCSRGKKLARWRWRRWWRMHDRRAS